MRVSYFVLRICEDVDNCMKEFRHDIVVLKRAKS